MPKTNLSWESPSTPVARVEQKFFLTPDRLPAALALLCRVCRRDPTFPADQVNSLYFDTPELDQHERSDSGEFTKDKVRIRWYGKEYDPHRNDLHWTEGYPLTTENCPPANELVVPVWLELKSRRGFASTKRRVKLKTAASCLTFPALGRGIVPASLLMCLLADFGFFFSSRLRPVIAVSYLRRRFVEPESGFRVSLDTRIRSSMVMPGLGRGERGLELAGAVVEVKGARFEIPRRLKGLAEIGSTWTRYSKYSASLEAHTTASPGPSRLWPSGIFPPLASERDAVLG